MKKVVLAAVVALGLGLGFAHAENKAAQELEHQIGTANEGAENVGKDMSKMKAAGKCNADQSAKVKTKATRPAKKPTKAELELEHANKTANDYESVGGKMGNMKAEGKCNTAK